MMENISTLKRSVKSTKLVEVANEWRKVDVLYVTWNSLSKVVNLNAQSFSHLSDRRETKIKYANAKIEVLIIRDLREEKEKTKYTKGIDI